eukprot:UN26804
MCQFFANSYIASGFGGMVQITWKTIDFISTCVCCLVEVNPDPSIDGWFKLLMAGFMAIHSVTYINEMYRTLSYLYWVIQQDIEISISNNDVQKMRRYLTQAKFISDIELAAIISFIFEEILGTSLQLWALNQYESLVNPVFILCLTIQ